MKVEVFIRSFGGPIMLAVLLIVWRLHGMTSFQTFLQTTFVISYVIAKLLSDVKYINTLLIHEDRFSISFYNHYSSLRHLEFDIKNIKDIKLSKRSKISWLWPPNLDFKLNDEPYSLEILSKELYYKIERQISEEILWGKVSTHCTS